MKKWIPILAAAAIGMMTSASDDVKAGSEILEKGKAIYMSTCFACHGIDGKGLVPGTPNLRGKKSPLRQENAVLKERIINGYQSKGSPMAMPPRGGNPKLSEQEIDAVIAYMKATFIKN